jgi:outer membrane protein assembly factor BamA
MKVFDNFYLGLGYHLDAYKNIEDLDLKLDSIPPQLTPHWSYSKFHGFDPKKYTMSGFSINAMYDSRDNQISAYKGYFARFNYQVNPTFLGSSQNSSQLWTEFRTYIGLSKNTPRHLIAFWYFGNFLVSGEQPYLTLMAIGDDQRLKSGRGYTAGRFRGQDFVYAEAEYRFPILRCAQTLGGVVFVNASTASNRDANVHLFDYVRPAVGFGFRLLMNKYSRMNISIDFAYGFDSKGTYFGGAETF